MPKIIRKITDSSDLTNLFFILWLSVLVHFWRITYPNSIVFDEVTFGKFLNSYAKGEYYFDLHPPLGKLILGWASYLGGINPNFNYDKIGTVFSEQTFIWLRSFTAFTGSLIPVFAALLLRGLGFSKWVAVIAAVLIIFENALLVISRTFVFDIFLLSFGFASIAVGVWSHRLKSKTLWWFSWILAASAFSIKWTGLSFLGILSLWEIQRGWSSKLLGVSLRRLMLGLSAAFAVYFLIFAVHFSWTPRSGMGNDFMSPEFQSGLIGNRYHGNPGLVRPSLWIQFIELNKMMWAYQKTMNQNHPYSSPWYSWPLMYRPIYFWGNTGGELKERIYLLGNPWLWLSSTLAVIFFFVKTWSKGKLWLKKSIDEAQTREFCLLLIFVANYIPFILIGRVMFIYHYLVALITALMILAVTLEKLKKLEWKWGFFIVAFGCFCFFAPLSYALPLTDSEYQWRLWLPSWL